MGNEFKILIDTNIFISAEDYKELPSHFAELLRILEEHHHIIYVHPASLKDLEKDPLEERKRIMKSRLKKYPLLESPPSPNQDQDFLFKIGPIKIPNDQIDVEFLYALYKNCVDFLLTEDIKIKKRAEKVGIAKRVLNIKSALAMFKKLHERKMPLRIPTVVRKKPYELNLEDPFFLSLKEEYPDFLVWYEKISKEGRDCWVYFEDGRIKALMIWKEEDEEVPIINNVIPKSRRLKICTLKVERTGYRLGELFLKMSFDYCIKNNLSEAYMTHFTKPSDPLVSLLERFGFEKIGEKLTGGRKEDVYFKKLYPSDKNTLRFHPLGISQKYYPSFADSKRVKKFIIPIKPIFHDRLFPEYPGRQALLNDFSKMSRINVPGNTIDKIYLCHAKTTQITPGSVILFYRSKEQLLTAVGVVQKVFRSKNAQEIIKLAGERTVYDEIEISEMAKRGVVLAIRFRFHFYLPNPISADKLIEEKVIKRPPQSIMEISHQNYLWIKKEGGIDERFTFN